MDGTSEVNYGLVNALVGNVHTPQQYQDTLNAAINAYAGTQGYTLTNGVIWDFQDYRQVQASASSTASALIATTPKTVSDLSLSLQTSTGAVGTQVSTTTGSWVTVSGQVSTTASIAGNAAGDIIVEVAPTNSATAGDWVEWGRIGNSQALSLAITLQSVQIVKGQVWAYVPTGYFIKARTSGSGTVSYTLNTVKKVSQ